MKQLTFKSIRARLIFWFLILALMPLLIGIGITFRQEKQALEQETFAKLTSIRDLKVQQLEKWFDERMGDMQVMAGDYEIKTLENIFEKKTKSPEDIKKIDVANKLLIRNERSYSDYEELFIVGANTGLIEISTNHGFVGKNKSNDPYFTVPLETGKIYIKDIYYSKTMFRPQMTISLPIYCLEHNKHIIGVLVARMNLDESLYKLLDNRIGLGETGETLIVNKDALALNDLRWYNNAPLNLQISAKPAINAARGKTGLIITEDYRNVVVMAAYTYIPRTGWGFVCKQDLYELNSPVRALIKNFIFLLALSVLIVIIIVFWVVKSITKPIVDINIAAQKIKGGDYSVRTMVTTHDEIASLSASINEMTASVQLRAATQKGVADISETMIGQASITDFGSKLLKQLMEITGANMSVFYILNEATSEYDHFASVGVNKELLNPFDARHPQGEFGNAISTKNIHYLRNIREDTIFKYVTVAGDAIPKEIITIPILVEETVVALISLVNINKFCNECYDILKQSWNGINISYSNLLASERTRVFAEQLLSTNQQLEAQSEELQDQAEELQQQTEELQRTSEELQEQNLELAAQKKQVEVANKLKSEFLSNMSHELRTPLNSIMALSRVLIMQAKDKLSDEENSYLEIVERNGKNLLSLINDILDLSKVEAGKMEILPVPVSLGALLRTVNENLQSLADDRGLTLTLSVPENLPMVETDESRLHQVLLNIINNAIKFTEKGSVEVSVNHDSKNVSIEVKDTGIGISKEDIPHIFDEFRQVDGTSARQYEGTGLGLAIASKMTNILGGNIKVNSSLGKGSVFIITIPVKWYEGVISGQLPGSVDDPLQFDDNTIIVVDDDPQANRDISEYLNKAGYKTISASSGKDALELAEKYQPFAITLDVIMPEMDGWEVLQKLKANAKTNDIPVVIISVDDDKDTGLALGAVGHINKPVDKDLLIELKRIIGGLEKLSNIAVLAKHTSETHILLVEDNEDAIIQIKSILEREGYLVDVAAGGQEALDFVKHTIPDGIVLDLMMPEIDGFEVLEKIRATGETKNIPVLILTAKDLTHEDLSRLSTNNIQQLIQKGDVDNEGLLNKVKLMLTPNKSRFQVSKTDLQYLANSSSPNVLIIEDNPDNIITLKAILKNKYYIAEAIDGEQGLKMAQSQKPDLILLDMSLPKVSGQEIIKQLKSNDETKHIPVVAVTAQAMMGDKERFIKMGCDGYISKPVDQEVLLRKLERLLI